MKKNDPRTNKKKNASDNLISRIERIEKKLDLINTMGKVMPVIVLTTGAILGSFVYLVSVAKMPDSSDVTQLPQTGDEATKEFTLLFPENFTTITLPTEIVGVAPNGFFPNDTKISFYAQKSGKEPVTIGKAEIGSNTGEYWTTWKSAPLGTYYLWAEIEEADGTLLSSSAIVVEIK